MSLPLLQHRPCTKTARHLLVGQDAVLPRAKLSECGAGAGVRLVVSPSSSAASISGISAPSRGDTPSESTRSKMKGGLLNSPSASMGISEGIWLYSNPAPLQKRGPKTSSQRSQISLQMKVTPTHSHNLKRRPSPFPRAESGVTFPAKIPE